MLRRFLYLNTTALSEYVTALEGGRLTESTTRAMQSGSGSGEVSAKVLRAGGERGHENEQSRTLSDTDEARFDRLLLAAESDAERLGWVEVLQPDVDLAKIGLGAMVSWECDLYIPQISQTLAKSGEAFAALTMMQTLLPAARHMGLPTEGLPSETEMSAAASLIGGMDVSLVVVGEDDGTEWQVAAHIDENFKLSELEGRARLVGKVSRVVPKGQWKPFLTFPGMNLGSREDRRRLERQRPAPGKEGEYLPGPALLVDLLALYR